MTAITAPKSPVTNWLEGVTLSAMLQGLPTFAGAALLLRLARQNMVAPGGGAITFVIIATVFYALLMPLLSGPRCRRIFRYGYEPLFFDPLLPVADKIARWRRQPHISVQLLTTTVMMSLLAVAALSMG